MPLDDSTAIKLGGIRCWDISLSMAFNDGVSTAKRVMQIDWQNIGKFIAYMKGYTGAQSIFPNANAQAMPDYPGMSVLTIDNINGVPGPDGPTKVNETISYKRAQLDVNYSSKNFGFTTQSLSSLSIDFGTDVINLPVGTIKVGGVKTIVPKPIFFPTRVIRITRKNLTSIPFDAIANAEQNPLNSSPVLLFGVTAAGLLKYNGCSVDEEITTSGTIYSITYEFKARWYRWDYDWPAVAPTSGVYKPVAATLPDGSPAYTMSDLNILLK